MQRSQEKLILINMASHPDLEAVAQRHDIEIITRSIYARRFWRLVEELLIDCCDENTRVAIRLTEFEVVSTILEWCRDPSPELSWHRLLPLKHIILVPDGVVRGDLDLRDPEYFLTYKNSLDLDQREKLRRLWRNLRGSDYMFLSSEQREIRYAVSKFNEALSESGCITVAYINDFDLINNVIRLIERDEDLDASIRFFVPKTLYIRVELDRFLMLIKQYCEQIGLNDIVSRSYETDLGTHYVFRVSDKRKALSRIEDVFAEFERFSRLAVSDPEGASKALVLAGVSTERATYISELVRRESIRLNLDLEMISRSRILKLEMEAKEHVLLGMQVRESSSMHTQELQTVVQVGTMNILGSFISAPAAVSEAADPREVDLRSLIRSQASGVEAQALEGDLAAVSDGEVNASERTSAGERLKRFVNRHAGKVEDAAVKAFLTWLQLKLSGH